jgi:5-methylcytosine-specific restriction endonuclease McrA
MGRLQTLKPRVGTADLRTAQPAAKMADGFYNTQAWRSARAMALTLGGFCCSLCGRRGCVLYVDHIVELQDGGAPYEQSNLRPLCGACHTNKTVAERAARMKG